jgi:hypothetical protein
MIEKLAVALRLSLLLVIFTHNLAAVAQQVQPAPNATAHPAPAAAATTARPAPITVQRSQYAERYIRLRWGIDEISVRSVSSGSGVEFRYKVIDPYKAAVLNDIKATPVLKDQESGQKLSVPQLENVGSLRQVAPPVAGKEYWMVFQDPRRQVKPGHHVDIAVGVVHLTGLTVE